MLIVDSQVHIWAPGTPERPWPKGRPAKPQRSEPFSVDDLLREMDAAGVTGAIIVPPSWEGDRNDLALAAAQAHPQRLAVMGRFDPYDKASPGKLAAWRAQPGMLGIRLTVRTENEIRVVTDPGFDWLWREAADAGVPVMFFPYGNLPLVHGLAQRYPSLRLVIDHMGLHRTQGPAAFVDIDHLIDLAKWPNVAVKASALPFYSAESYPFADVQPYLRRTFDAYGPRRVFWGSDLTRMRCPYRETIKLFTEELAWLRGGDLESVMGRGICAWLGWSRSGG